MLKNTKKTIINVLLLFEIVLVKSKIENPILKSKITIKKTIPNTTIIPIMFFHALFNTLISRLSFFCIINREISQKSHNTTEL